MYPSPYPTPLIAGRTYITYQPLMPHEYMYWHHRSYHRYYDGGKGLNRTIVKYSRNPAAVALQNTIGSGPEKIKGGGPAFTSPSEMLCARRVRRILRGIPDRGFWEDRTVRTKNARAEPSSW